MTKVVTLEFAKQNIRVNAGCPGGVATDMYKRFVANEPDLREGMNAAHPMGCVGLPEEIASAVIWLYSPGASFVTGHSITIDGGYTAQYVWPPARRGQTTQPDCGTFSTPRTQVQECQQGIASFLW